MEKKEKKTIKKTSCIGIGSKTGNRTGSTATDIKTKDQKKKRRRKIAQKSSRNSPVCKKISLRRHFAHPKIQRRQRPRGKKKKGILLYSGMLHHTFERFFRRFIGFHHYRRTE